jgi:hypothetical protein
MEAFMARPCTRAEAIAHGLGVESGKDIRTLIADLEASSDFWLTWREHENFLTFSALCAQYFLNPEAYLVFDEFGIWPSSENIYLYRGLTRFSLGIDDYDPKVCVHFDSANTNDLDALTSFLQLGLSFGWGGVLIGNSREFFRFSHDSWGLLKGSPEFFATIKESSIVLRAEARL